MEVMVAKEEKMAENKEEVVREVGAEVKREKEVGARVVVVTVVELRVDTMGVKVASRVVVKEVSEKGRGEREGVLVEETVGQEVVVRGVGVKRRREAWWLRGWLLWGWRRR